MIENTYKVNGEAPKKITDGSASIDMSSEQGVKAGCTQYPIPLLNKITVTSTETEGGPSTSTSIYAGYKVVNQLLGAIVDSGSSYNTGTPRLNTIISNGRFGMFEPAHYNMYTGNWSNHNMRAEQINSLINVGIGVKICVKIEYTKIGGSPAVEYVHIPAEARFFGSMDTEVPRYDAIGVSALIPAETVESEYIEGPRYRTWFESVLNTDILNVKLSAYITDPDTSQNITITLMAYIGSTPTADNTFPILPMNAQSITSITCQFQTYDPIITIANKDTENNPDAYADGYGSVADYDTGTEDDTTINIGIVAP